MLCIIQSTAYGSYLFYGAIIATKERLGCSMKYINSTCSTASVCPKFINDNVNNKHQVILSSPSIIRTKMTILTIQFY